MDIPELKKLIKLFENSKISELELEQDNSKVRLKKSRPPRERAPHNIMAQAPITATPPAPQVNEKPAISQTGNHIIKAPMVGTFYRSPSPSAPPFVEEGDTVRKGQVLCIIEAMKLMNDIECEVAGKIVTVFPETGKPVEFGEPLFEIVTT